MSIFGITQKISNCRNGFAGGLAVYVHSKLNFTVNENLSSAFFHIGCVARLRGTRRFILSVSTYMKAHLESMINHRSNLIRKFNKRQDQIWLRNKREVLNVKVSRLQSFYKEKYYEDMFQGCNGPKDL